MINTDVMTIEENKIVSLTYTLRIDSENGEIAEQLTEDKPLKFLVGSQQLLQKFEENIKGLSIGESFSFMLAPTQAYGDVNKDAIVSLDKNIFIVDGVLRDDLLQIGKVIPMKDNSGSPLNGKVIEIGAKEVTLDFNHPMAGKSLYFKGEILEVNDATAQEMAQGYPEGMGGGCGSGGCACGSNDGSCGSDACATDSCGSDSGGGCGSGCGCH